MRNILASGSCWKRATTFLLFAVFGSRRLPKTFRTSGPSKVKSRHVDRGQADLHSNDEIQSLGRRRETGLWKGGDGRGKYGVIDDAIRKR